MKNFFLILTSLFLISSIHAQVGVNTETPATTLHVLPTRTDGATAEGIIAPNLKRSEVIAKDNRYTAPQTGAMIYVSDLSGTLTTKTAKITSTGYYYFDGTLWQPFTNGAMGTVTDANNGLTMSGTTVKLGGALTAATSITGASKLTLSTPLQITSGTPGAGKVLSSDASGNTSWQEVLDIYTPHPIAADNGLSMFYDNTVELGGNLHKATSITGTDRLTLATPTTISGSFQVSSGAPGSGKVLTSDASGNATWGTLPAATVTTANNGLTMSGTTTQLGGALTKATSITGASVLTLATPLQISSGTPGAGKVLTSDASGNTTWGTLPAATVTTANNGLTMNGTTTQLGGALTAATNITGTSRLTLATPTTVSGALQISSGTPGAGKVLTSDASGNATWAASSSPWNKVGTTLPSVLNTDNSYLTAKTVIGGNTIASINGGTGNAQLTVIGEDASINGITVGRGASNRTTNTAVGANSLEANTTGTNNTAIGSNTLKSNQSSSFNTAMGFQALQGNTTGLGYNTAIGALAGSGLTTGSSNTAIGYSAGANLTTGGYSLAIGYNVSLPDPAANFQMNIGNAIHGVTSLTAGGGRVSIGKTTPDTGVFLDVAGLTQITGAGKFKYVDSNQLSGRVLSTDNNGVAKWADQNMLSGNWFYVPSINLDMSSTTQKTVNIFTQCVQQLITATPIAASTGYIRPTLPTTATAYDYMVIGSSGHITNVSISTSGVLTYTPTTNNPPPFAYVNIMVRVK